MGQKGVCFTSTINCQSFCFCPFFLMLACDSSRNRRKWLKMVKKHSDRWKNGCGIYIIVGENNY